MTRARRAKGAGPAQPRALADTASTLTAAIESRDGKLKRHLDDEPSRVRQLQSRKQQKAQPKEDLTAVRERANHLEAVNGEVEKRLDAVIASVQTILARK